MDVPPGQININTFSSPAREQSIGRMRSGGVHPAGVGQAVGSFGTGADGASQLYRSSRRASTSLVRRYVTHAHVSVCSVGTERHYREFLPRGATGATRARSRRHACRFGAVTMADTCACPVCGFKKCSCVCVFSCVYVCVCVFYHILKVTL